MFRSLTDRQGVGLYLVKSTEYFKNLKVFKNTEFKILTINLGVVAAILLPQHRGF